MVVATDRVSYEAGWTRFVDSIEEFWTRFRKEGDTLSAAFCGWVGNKKYEDLRSNDPLLRYVRRARNQSQHGNISVGWTPPAGLTLGQGFCGGISSLVVLADGTFSADAEPADISRKKSPVSADYGTPFLPTFYDKHAKETITAPDSHLGNNNLRGLPPHRAASHAILFYNTALNEAVDKFVN